MSLLNLPGPWTWEQRGEYWYYVNEGQRISCGPYTLEEKEAHDANAQ